MLSFCGEKKKSGHGKKECRNDTATKYQLHLCPSLISNNAFLPPEDFGKKGPYYNLNRTSDKYCSEMLINEGYFFGKKKNI
jgi:hypothetical protein